MGFPEIRLPSLTDFEVMQTSKFSSNQFVMFASLPGFRMAG